MRGTVADSGMPALCRNQLEANNIRFDRLVPWLRQYVTLPSR